MFGLYCNLRINTVLPLRKTKEWNEFLRELLNNTDLFLLINDGESYMFNKSTPKVLLVLALSQCKAYKTIFKFFLSLRRLLSWVLRTSRISGLSFNDFFTFYKFRGSIQFWFNLRFTLHKMCELRLSRISSWRRAITTSRIFDCSNHSWDRKTSTCNWSWSSTTITSTVEPLYPIYLYLFRSTSFRFLDILFWLVVTHRPKCNMLCKL